MISFECENCRQNYSVPDERAGQRTRCAKCGSRLTVPERCDVEVLEDDAEVRNLPKRRQRPPAKVVLGLVAGSLVFLFAFGWLLYTLTPNPSKESVERSLRQNLPAGYEKLEIGSYDRDGGRLAFNVTYHEPGDLIGVDYEVVRYYDTGFLGKPGWKVQVTGRKRQLNFPGERWLMVEAVFDRRGQIVWKQGITAAGLGEGPAVEERARRIAMAVGASF